MIVKLYEWIDTYIAENHEAPGETYTRGDIVEWMTREGHAFDVDSALQSHRESPSRRTFTTKRTLLGPRSYYEIVEVEKGVWPKAVREMSKQIGEEAVRRAVNEIRRRMEPLAKRNKKALELLDQAETEWTLVASIFDMKLGELLDEEDDVEE